MAKKKKWGELDQTNLTGAILRLKDAACDLSNDIDYLEDLLGDASVVVSTDDLSNLIVAQRYIADLLRILISAKQLSELREENDRLRKGGPAPK